jgi:uncharacterized protein
MCSDRTEPFSTDPDGLTLYIRLTPKGGRDAIYGFETLSDGKSVLKARVRAVPEDGKANIALMKLIAETFACPVSTIAIVSGATARIKTLRIKGDSQKLMLKLQESLTP